MATHNRLEQVNRYSGQCDGGVFSHHNRPTFFSTGLKPADAYTREALVSVSAMMTSVSRPYSSHSLAAGLVHHAAGDAAISEIRVRLDGLVAPEAAPIVEDAQVCNQAIVEEGAIPVTEASLLHAPVAVHHEGAEGAISALLVALIPAEYLLLDHLRELGIGAVAAGRSRHRQREEEAQASG